MEARPAQVKTAPVEIDPVERRPAMVSGDPSLHDITDAVARPLEWTPPRGWYVTFGISLSLLGLFVLSIGWLFWEGVGVWGNNVPVGWGWPIVSFVFWVGIAHAGTLISAILFLFRQRWRTSINRAAEAMTLFAVVCALAFPAIHTGRPWLDYWMMPFPNQMDTWPQFRSPLMWDVFAVGIYATVSLLFWYLGLIPDLATLRDRAKSKIRQVAYGIFALGWRGSHRQWVHYESAYLLLAGLATPLVVSVHSVVSFDFAASQLPGWHSTILPPYFVAGAIFSGLAMVVTLMLICRVVFKLENLITMLHFDRMAKLILVTGSMVGYVYVLELFFAWYSGNPYERYAFWNRTLGPYAWASWVMIFCNAVVPQLFWLKRARSSIPILFGASILINVGMWFERFVIVVTSLHRDFLPSSWSYFTPTLWDVTTLAGSFGLFFTLFCLFVRYLPMVSMSEVKSVLPGSQPLHGDSGGALPPPGLQPVASKDEKAGVEDYQDDGDGGVYGLLAEFATAGELAKACRGVHDAGYRHFDAHTPYPVHGLERAMGLPRSRVPRWVLILGLSGAVLGLLMQWWVSAVAYPIIVSGKPLFSWPAFVPIMFECAILGGALGAVVGFLVSSRLPQHYHELFRVERFDRVTDDSFFLSVESKDVLFGAKTKHLLANLGARSVEPIPG